VLGDFFASWAKKIGRDELLFLSFKFLEELTGILSQKNL
jgi:hypothetical protein